MANLGPLSELEKGEFPKKVPYKVKIQDAWVEQEREGFVYINKNIEGDSLLIYVSYLYSFGLYSR